MEAFKNIADLNARLSHAKARHFSTLKPRNRSLHCYSYISGYKNGLYWLRALVLKKVCNRHPLVSTSRPIKQANILDRAFGTQKA